MSLTFNRAKGNFLEGVTGDLPDFLKEVTWNWRR